MTYFARLRLDYISWRLACKGEVQRGDLTRTFGVCESQASADINALLADEPGAASYDKTRKRYTPRYSRGPAARLVKIAAALGWD